MNPQKKLITFLNDVLQKEQLESRETLASYIVGELICDYDNVYKDLQKNNPIVVQIADLASDLEWSNGSEEQLKAMWRQLKALINELQEVYPV